MSLSASTLESLIIQKLNSHGIITDGEHAKANLMAKAIAEAVVEHIKAEAKAKITGGSSTGEWPIV